MVVASVPDIAGHVHERLSGEGTTGAPVSNRHGGGLVADGLNLGDGAAPAGEEVEGILSKPKTIPQSSKFAYFVQYAEDFVAMVMKGYCSGATSESRTNDNCSQWRIV